VRIVIATPTARPALTGNATTAERWARGLRARGHEATVLAAPAEWCAADFERALHGLALPREGSGPLDVVHLLHAWKCGRFVDEARRRAKRVVVSFAGTDLDPLLDAERRATVRRACERADALVVPGADISVAAPFLEGIATPAFSVPKGVLLGDGAFDLRRGSQQVFFVLPAGVREVKRPRLPIRPLERLRAEGLAIRYVVLGPELEAEESRALAREFESRPWCSRLEAPPEAMPAALRAADVVLNVSRVEGFANVLAEALAASCCVLAADIPGNRAALGSSGVLFSDEADFEKKARALALDPERRRSLGAAARQDARARFDPEREIDALLVAFSKR